MPETDGAARTKSIYHPFRLLGDADLAREKVLYRNYRRNLGGQTPLRDRRKAGRTHAYQDLG